MIRWFREWRARRKLRKILRAIKVTLSLRQRVVVLDPDRPEFRCWGKGSGKTLAACVWTLVWRKQDIDEEQEIMKLNHDKNMHLQDSLPAIPDPDADNYKSFRHTLQVYRALAAMCEMEGVKVAHVKLKFFNMY